jgi:hypothetical protein
MKQPERAIHLNQKDIVQIHIVYSESKLALAVQELLKNKSAEKSLAKRNDAVIMIIVTHMGKIYKCFTFDRSRKSSSNSPVLSVVWTMPFVSFTENVDSEQLGQDLEGLFPDEDLVELDAWRCKTFGFDVVLSVHDLEMERIES